MRSPPRKPGFREWKRVPGVVDPQRLSADRLTEARSLRQHGHALSLTSIYAPDSGDPRRDSTLARTTRAKADA